MASQPIVRSAPANTTTSSAPDRSRGPCDEFFTRQPCLARRQLNVQYSTHRRPPLALHSSAAMNDIDRHTVVPYARFLATREHRRPIVERPQPPPPTTSADVPPPPDETHAPPTTSWRTS
jgi:hypothetical protein